jgi:hypothetical protein
MLQENPEIKVELLGVLKSFEDIFKKSIVGPISMCAHLKNDYDTILTHKECKYE